MLTHQQILAQMLSFSLGEHKTKEKSHGEIMESLLNYSVQQHAVADEMVESLQRENTELKKEIAALKEKQ